MHQEEEEEEGMNRLKICPNMAIDAIHIVGTEHGRNKLHQQQVSTLPNSAFFLPFLLIQLKSICAHAIYCNSESVQLRFYSTSFVIARHGLMIIIMNVYNLFALVLLDGSNGAEKEEMLILTMHSKCIVSLSLSLSVGVAIKYASYPSGLGDDHHCTHTAGIVVHHVPPRYDGR